MNESTAEAGAAALSIPRGGASLRGLGEKFQANPFTGSGAFTFPIPITPGRDDFTPDLTLRYSTGNGNGCFGLGWALPASGVARKTEKGLPRYQDDDVFVLSGAEDLTPELKPGNNQFVERPVGSYTVRCYLPRTDGSFTRIERWQRADGDVHWRTISISNVTTIYGRESQSRIYDPADPSRVFSWLIEETFDAKGNHIRYDYARDDPALNVPALYEQGRTYAQVYLRRIYYGNLPGELRDEHGQPVTYASGSPVGVERRGVDHLAPLAERVRRYAFEVVFDYGDWDAPGPDRSLSVTPAGTYHPPSAGGETFGAQAPLRPDPFSSYRSGFELRTLRRCRRVVVFHHFRELGGPTPVKVTHFEYEQEQRSGISLLREIVVSGYRSRPGGYLQRHRPPVGFSYSHFQPDRQRYQEIEAVGGDLPPKSLGDPDTALVDLFGDGLPDFLETTPDGFHYWRNLGNGRLDRRHVLHEAPVGVRLSNPGVTFGDLSGDGMADLIVGEPVAGFYEMTSSGGWNRQRFRHFHRTPTVPFSDPHARPIDLTGDGLTDILVTADHHFLWLRSLGEEGYAAAEPIERIFDLREFPHISFDDPAGRVRLADMTGDGLRDIVLIHNARIDYWPNLGYGRFGRRVTMASSPQLDSDFDPRRLLLADLDGSGAADLVYVEYGRVHFWFNRSGNSWSERETIHGTPAVTDQVSLRFADVFGNGANCLIWSQDYDPAGGALRVLDFTGGVRPHLLVEMTNNCGATTRVQYAPSTKFLLEDRAQGMEWFTPLPFPVQVVERVESIDHVSKTKLVTQYRYHHGYFDGAEREFRGFGRVDQLDSEAFAGFSGPGLHGDGAPFDNAREPYFSPPVETRTWYHTGLCRDENLAPDGSLDHDALLARYRSEYDQSDPAAFTPPPLAIEIEPGAAAEAFRALAGAELRREVYGRDGSALESRPFTVTETIYRVKRLQPRGPSRYGVYAAEPQHQISYAYERNPADPRVSHQITVETDRYGNPVRRISIAYPRRPQAGQNFPDSQRRLRATLNWTRFINKDDQAQFRWIGLPCESRLFELAAPSAWDGTRLLLASDFTSELDEGVFAPFEDSPAVSRKRLLSWTQTYYRGDDSLPTIDSRGSVAHRLPHGEVGRLGLIYEAYEAAFSPGLLQRLYQGAVTPQRLTAAGYVGSSSLDQTSASWPTGPGVNGYWWKPSGRQGFEDPATGFVQSIEKQDPFGKAAYTRYDPYRLAVRESEDAVGNVWRSEYDYHVVLPASTVDPNGNATEIAYDALGLAIATALVGANGEGDTLVGLDADPPPGFVVSQIADPLAQPESALAGATSRVLYDIDAFAAGRGPSTFHLLTRETHRSDLAPGAKSKLQHRRLFMDGMGRFVQVKQIAPPAAAAPAAPRWVASGSAVYNNKGAKVRQFEPFFSTSPAFGLETHGVSSTAFFDPLGREVLTLHPNHTYEKIKFTPWNEETWDAGDTIHPLQRYDTVQSAAPAADFNPANDPDVGFLFAKLDPVEYLPAWFQRRRDPALAQQTWPDPAKRAAEERAAAVAARYSASPQITTFDNLGRRVLDRNDNGDDAQGSARLLEVRYELDIQGNELAIVDPRGVRTFEFGYDMLGRRAHTTSADAGRSCVLVDVLGNTVYRRDAKGAERVNLYDDVRRPVEVWVRLPGGSWRLLEKTVYGESRTVPGNSAYRPENTNHRRQVWKVYDGAGLTENIAFDFRGQPLESRRVLPADARNPPVWAAHSEPLLGRFDAAAADALLDTNLAFTMGARQDALLRMTENRLPDGTRQLMTYDESSRLKTLSVERDGSTDPIVLDAQYDAKGQRTKIRYGNGVTTDYFYESDTFRLERMHSYRATQARALLLQLHYTYDAVGNPTEIRDAAIESVYFPGQAIEASSLFEYDPLYRLLSGTGREHQALSACHDQLDFAKNTVLLALGQPGLRNYREDYAYDDAGNLTTVSHWARSGGAWSKQWDRVQTYETQAGAPKSNRLTHSDAGCAGESALEIGYDANGNILNLPHLAAFDAAGTPRECLRWDHKNQLAAAELNANGDKAYFQYDVLGNRIRKFVERGASSLERIYLGALEISIERAAAGATVERYTTHILDGVRRVAVIEDARSGLTAPAASRQLRYHLSNHLNSSLAEVDGSPQARLLSLEEFSPFGRSSFLATPAGPGGAPEPAQKRYRFSAKERDDESSLIYFGARYYAPWLGRWLSCDPVAPNGELNLYAYARNSPEKFADPTGRQAFEPDPTGIQIPTHGKESVAPGQRGPDSGGQLRLRTRFFRLEGIPHIDADIPSAFDAARGRFLGTGGMPEIRTSGPLHGQGLATRIRAEHFRLYASGGHAPLRSFSLQITHGTTVEALRLGTPFERTYMWGHLVEAAGEIGLRPGAYRLQPQSFGVGHFEAGLTYYRVVGSFIPYSYGGGLPTGISRTFGVPPPAAAGFGRLMLRGGPFLLLGAFASTPVSYSEDGTRHVTPGDFLYDPHYADRIASETDYFIELAKFKAGERATEPIPPWTPPGELNALGLLGQAIWRALTGEPQPEPQPPPGGGGDAED